MCNIEYHHVFCRSNLLSKKDERESGDSGFGSEVNPCIKYICELFHANEQKTLITISHNFFFLQSGEGTSDASNMGLIIGILIGVIVIAFVSFFAYKAYKKFKDKTGKSFCDKLLI